MRTKNEDQIMRTKDEDHLTSSSKTVVRKYFFEAAFVNIV